MEKDGQKLIELAGKNGRFQQIVLIVIIMFNVILYYTIISLPLQKLRPEALCKNKNNFHDQFSKCTFDQYCDKENYEVIILPEKSMYNWNVQYKLTCDQEVYFDYLVTMIFFGQFLSSLVFSVFADTYGRLPVMKLEIYAIIICMAFTIYSPYFSIMMLAFFGVNVFQHVTTLLSVYSYEIFNQSLYSFTTTISNMLFPLCGFSISFLFYFFNNWYYIHSIIIFQVALGLFLFKYYFVESPQYLLSNKRVEEFLCAVVFIAKINSQDINFESETFKSNFYF